MYHLRKIKVLLATCLLACSSLWAQDTKISLTGATAEATSDQGGNEAASSAIDGDYSKFWHSQWSWGAVFEKVNSVDLTIALSEVTLVDYVRYIPRQGSPQGHWGEVEVFYSSNTTGTSFTSVGTFNLNKADIPHDFFLNGTEGVRCGQIKFTIRSGSNNHATAAEIEMYQLNRDKLNAFAQCFSDAVYTELKPGITSSSIADADVKALVQSMQSNPTSYKKFRVGEYEAYETLGTLQQRLKTKNQYSRYENPTGVYFTEGQSYLVAVSGIEDDAVGLKVKNWYLSESSSTYSLRNGLNYITATTEGNVFVNYYTDNYAEAPKVKIHFINAPVIGYWDQETMTNSDWEEMLKDKAADDNRIIITQSKHAQTAFPISAWKTHCPDDVETLMGHYQNVQWAIRDMMGLEKYGYQTRNRQIFYVVNRGFMAAGDEGAYCNYSSLGGIMNPNSFDFWGVGHEWGHNNQIHPGFHWSGCGETTNNIYASWAQYHFTPHRDAARNPYNLRLEDEVTGIDEYASMRGGRMQTYFEEALRKGVAWQLQDGPDYHGATLGDNLVDEYDADGNQTGKQVPSDSRNYDHFVKLTPFWQLNLWGNEAGKCPDIITDVIHSIRTAENYTVTYNTNGKQQINWMKLACDHAGIDLLPFFEKAGMLVPIHAYIEDYGAGWNIITEEMIANLKAYVKQKGYPAFTEEINYINAYNMHVYRDNLKLNVTKMQGELNGNKLTIQHSVDGNPLNAVAFETYNAQGELIRITMYGLGSNDEHSFTQVLFPSDADYVMAVGYDGERQKVYQKRTADELQTLINEAQALIDEVGVVRAEKVNLGTDAYFCNARYTESNNGDKFTSYSVLNDGDHATYLHTDYGATAPDEDHYISVDLGSVNERAYLSLNYVTRKEGNVCAPTKVAIEGSDDETDWVTLNEFVSGLPETNNASQTLNFGNATSYRYIRMRVYGTSDGQKSNGHHYFIVSELGISAFDVALNQDYLSMSKNVVLDVYMALQSAQNENAFYELLDKYNALLAAREEMDKLNELKAPLKTLIGSTNSLIAQCGTVVFNAATPDTELALQTSNKSEYYYLSTNANEPLEGSLDNLIDTSDDTYFHSAWSWDVADVHNLKVDMGEGKSLKEFTFTYKTTKGLFPTEINVYGSNDASQSELLHTFTKDNDGLPTAVGRSWTSSVISSEAAYRYIRFEVTESDGGGYGATPKGEYCFVMSYFGITEKAKPEGYTVTLGNEAGDVTEELLLTAYKAVQEAQSVFDYANTEAQVNEAIEKLQAQYQALKDAKNSVVNVEYTISTNVAGGGVIYKEQPYTTTLTAPNTLTESDLTAIGIEGYPNPEVIVNHETGVISVTYTLDKSALGDLLDRTRVLIDECGGFVNSEFVTEDFDALLREANTAWDIAQEVYETVQTPNELSDALNALQTVHDKLYTAKESAMTEMKGLLSNLIRATNTLVRSCYEAETFRYEGSLNVTEALIAKTNEVLDTANKTYDSEFNAEDYESALHDLTIAKQNLATAIAYAMLPVQLTFDTSSPVTYKIKIARPNTPVLAYDASSAMVAVTTFELGNKSHAWYFMATTDGKVLIMPYHDRNTTLALSTNEFTAGNSKVKGMPIGEEGYTQEWTITNANMNEANRNAGWYNITTINPTNTNTTWYFSNHGGASNKMGFYNDANDDGSRFQFEMVDFSKPETYYTLSNYYHNEAKVSGTVTGGTVVGCYPEAAADAYNTAYSNAANVLQDAMATDEDYTNAYNELKAANEALNLIMPEVGKYYAIVSACNDNRGGQLMYATGENGMKFSGEKTAQSPDALWTFTEEGYMMNLQTGCYVGTSDWGKALILVENGAKVVSFESLLTSDGQVMLKPGNSYPLHAQVSGSTIVGYKNDNNASAWRIVEVEDMSLVNFALSMSQYEHAGLYLNYAVEIPENVNAYYIAGDEIAINAEGVGTLKLTKIENGVIPACTGVILNAPEGNYAFNYVKSDAIIEGKLLLTGSTYLQYRAAEEGHSYYNFGQKDRVVGLYKNSVKYKYNDEGAIEEVTEGATHYKMSANKVLFDYWDNTESHVTSFRFSIGDETGIEGITIDADATIYDLYGRRVLEVVTPGLYIINGEKRYINLK